jgi:hypothetical protein
MTEHYDYHDIYDEKLWYVTKKLEPAMKAAGLDIAGLDYAKYGDYGDIEIVTINYYGGHTDCINVTGNSLAAILKEVVRQAIDHDAVGYIAPR